MYYPKSKIKENLFTKGGEYFVTATQENYTGYYYKVADSQYFTGKNPSSPNSFSLTPYSTPQPQNLSSPPQLSSKINYSVITDPSYLESKNITNFFIVNNLPIYYHPIPTEQDYQIGEFERYFLSKINETKFVETNKLEYLRYLNSDPDVSYQLYTPIKLSWVLTGKREQVYEVNLKSAERVQFNFRLRGFTQYFKGRFTQFYREVGTA